MITWGIFPATKPSQNLRISSIDEANTILPRRDLCGHIDIFQSFLEIILKHLGSFLRLSTLVQNWDPPTLSIISWSDPVRDGNIFWSCTKLKQISKRGSHYLQCHLSKSSPHVNHICIVIPRGRVKDAEYFFSATSPFVPRRDIQSFWPQGSDPLPCQLPV